MHRAEWSTRLQDLAASHACSGHELFIRLESIEPTRNRVSALLRNYDAHAGLLRRLLIKAAAIMPEEACGYVLENVRNEYGNGDPGKRHQLQLLDLARQAGVKEDQFRNEGIKPGIRSFMRQVVSLYNPRPEQCPPGLKRSAISAGAITATEFLAIKEFRYMQKFFAKLGLEHHIWFNHINVEVEHFEEASALAIYFIMEHQASQAVEHGLTGVLNANVALYDGLLDAIS